MLPLELEELLRDVEVLIVSDHALGHRSSRPQTAHRRRPLRRYTSNDGGGFPLKQRRAGKRRPRAQKRAPATAPSCRWGSSTSSDTCPMSPTKARTQPFQAKHEMCRSPTSVMTLRKPERSVSPVAMRPHRMPLDATMLQLQVLPTSSQSLDTSPTPGRRRPSTSELIDEVLQNLESLDDDMASLQLSCTLQEGAKAIAVQDC